MRYDKFLTAAYLLFLFVCCFLEGAISSEHWRALVAAMTLSGMLLTIVNLNSDLMSDAIEYSEESRKMLNILRPSAESFEKLVNPENKEDVALLAHAKKEIAMVESLSKRTERNYFIEKLICGLSVVMAFFIIPFALALPSAMKGVFAYQDRITICAFAVVVLTQLIQAQHNDRIKELRNYLNDHKNLWETMQKKLAEEGNAHAD